MPRDATSMDRFVLRIDKISRPCNHLRRMGAAGGGGGGGAGGGGRGGGGRCWDRARRRAAAALLGILSIWVAGSDETSTPWCMRGADAACHDRMAVPQRGRHSQMVDSVIESSSLSSSTMGRSFPSLFKDRLGCCGGSCILMRLRGAGEDAHQNPGKEGDAAAGVAAAVAGHDPPQSVASPASPPQGFSSALQHQPPPSTATAAASTGTPPPPLPLPPTPETFSASLEAPANAPPAPQRQEKEDEGEKKGSESLEQEDGDEEGGRRRRRARSESGEGALGPVYGPKRPRGRPRQGKETYR